MLSKSKSTKRSAKQTKSPKLTAGSGQEPKGPFQGQEIKVSSDQLESVNSRAPQPSSSEDSEPDAVDMDNDSDTDDEQLPRSKIRLTIKETLEASHIVPSRKEMSRKEKADEADRKQAEKVAKAAVVSSEAQQAVAKKAAVAEQAVVRNEVVIVGTLRFMHPMKLPRKLKQCRLAEYSDESMGNRNL